MDASGRELAGLGRQETSFLHRSAPPLAVFLVEPGHAAPRRGASNLAE